MMSPHLAHEPPAGGAPLLQVLLTGLIVLGFLAPVAAVVVAERLGRVTVVGRLADAVAARSGLPRWAGLPAWALVASLLSAGLGVYWDVPYHVDLGRDEGPLANPAHYFILFGLLGVFSSGLLSCGLATDRLPRRTLPLTWWRPTRRAPIGAVLVTVSGASGLLGFPLDDVWHRIFGQDVTEWGPTHVLMLGGAVVSTVGAAVLMAEARQVGARGRATRRLEVTFALWWLLGINAFLMEYDVGVPQFPLVAQVAIVAVAGTWPLVWARSVSGPGAALVTVGLFLAGRAVLTFAADELAGRTTHHFSLFLAHAVLIEVLAMVVPTRSRYRFGVLAGVLGGTLGTVAEWGWTHLFLPLPWPTSHLPLYVGYGLLAGVGAGLIAAWQLGRLDDIASPQPPVTRPGRRENALLAVGAVLALGTLAVSVPRTAGEPVPATMTLEPAGAGTAVVTVRLDEAAVRDHVWFYAMAWQGGGSVRATMEPAGDGSYRSARPMPVSGGWKTLIRLHTSTNRLVALPVYLPEDRAIPVDEVPATSGTTRHFGPEQPLLQREAKLDVSRVLWYGGYAVLLLLYLALFGAITALYRYAARPDDSDAATPERRDDVGPGTGRGREVRV